MSWGDFKNRIEQAAEMTIGKESKTRRNDWWDSECSKAILLRNEARKKILQIRTRVHFTEYQEMRKCTNRVCQKKKKEWVNRPVGQIEENFR